MGIQVAKKKGESSEKLHSRFNKEIQQWRGLNEVKDRKNFAKKPTKRKIRAAAVMREYHRAERKRKQHYS